MRNGRCRMHGGASTGPRTRRAWQDRGGRVGNTGCILQRPNGNVADVQRRLATIGQLHGQGCTAVYSMGSKAQLGRIKLCNRINYIPDQADLLRAADRVICSNV